jgi:predicted ATPase
MSKDPLYIRQQIISLFDDGMLCFDGNEWTWNIAAIERAGMLSGDIASMVSDKIKRLPPHSQHVLKVSTMGAVFCFVFISSVLINS